MKKLIMCSFIALPLIAATAAAECQHGYKAAVVADTDNHTEEMNEILDPELLALLKKQQEEKEALQLPISYN